MKRYAILLFVLVISCNNKPITHQPIVLESKVENRTFTLIIGSDTQSVDSLYNRRFDTLLKYSIFGMYDTFSVYDRLRKFYIPAKLEKVINNYIVNHCTSDLNYDSFRMSSIGYAFTAHSKKGGIRCCMNFKDSSAFVFYKGLKRQIENSDHYDAQSKLILCDLKPLMEGSAFPMSPEQKKIILKKFIQTQLTPEQKKLFRSMINIDDIKFVDKPKKEEK